MDAARWQEIKSSDPSWFCDFLKENTVFDGDNIEAMWREMVSEIERLRRDEEGSPRFRMDANGNLTRIESDL